MKKDAKLIIGISLLGLWLAFGLAATAQAQQSRDTYVISTKAGGVNSVVGNVTVERESNGRRLRLTSSDDLLPGDSVTTEAGAQVEVLLNPGSYMRVGQNSEFELVDTSLDNLLVRLVKGSAVVEVTEAYGLELAIGIKTPQMEASIIKGGIYRFNVLPNETTEVIVRKGRVRLGTGEKNLVKGGRKVIIGRGLLEVVKIDKKEKDELDLWSKDRAEMLAKANRKLQERALTTAFNSFDGWGSPLGLWVYNSRFGGYCFLPGYSSVWRSPYGNRYGTGVGQGGGYGGNNWPQGGGNPQPTGNNNPTTGNNGAPGGNGNPAPAPAPPSAPPPMPSQPAPPMRDTSGERTPTKVYTDQNPNR